MTIRAVLLVGLLFAAVTQPTTVWGQKPSKMYRVGWVHVASPPPQGGQLAHVGALPPLEVFRARLAERWVRRGEERRDRGAVGRR